jgi:hypothetical protein
MDADITTNLKEFIAGMRGRRGMKQDLRSIWVAVSLLEGERNSVVEYHGKVQQEFFEDIVSNRLREGLFRMESVAWINKDGDLQKMEEAQTGGKSYGYSNTAYFRVEQITRIVPLKDDFVMLALNFET